MRRYGSSFLRVGGLGSSSIRTPVAGPSLSGLTSGDLSSLLITTRTRTTSPNRGSFNGAIELIVQPRETSTFVRRRNFCTSPPHNNPEEEELEFSEQHIEQEPPHIATTSATTPPLKPKKKPNYAAAKGFFLFRLYLS